MSAASAEGVLTAGALVLGACVGSFLNVVVARVPAGLSVVHPRSRCPRCLTPIAWWDNVPVLSWVLLRARCRSCRAPISMRYPLVELLGASAAWWALRRHGPGAEAAAELAFVAVLLALALIDLDTWLLPNVLTWPLLAGGALLSALGLTAAPGPTSSLWGAGIGFAVFAAISVVGARIFRREALGFGDVWLLAAIGAWEGMGALLPVVLLASLQGSAVGIALALLGKLPGGAESPEPPATGPPATEPPATEPPVAATSEPGAAPATPAPAGGEPEEAWTPPRNAVPFGPFLVAGALQWLYLSEPVARLFPALRLFL